MKESRIITIISIIMMIALIPFFYILKVWLLNIFELTVMELGTFPLLSIFFL